jgi:AraC-like DNA-binding protein
MHLHDYCELALVRSGEFTVMSEDMQMTFAGPCLEMFRKNCLHAQFDKSHTTYERYLIRLDSSIPALLEPLVHQISRSAVSTITVIPLSAEEMDWLAQIMNHLNRLAEEGAAAAEERFIIPLRCLLEEINRICKDQQSIPAEFGELNILYVLSYIREHLTEKLTLDAIAAYMHCGKTKLSTAFRKYTGMSVHQYIIEERLELSLDYMKKDYNLSDIAALCGFSDSAHYIRTFQKVYGETPARYREMQMQLQLQMQMQEGTV